MTKSQQVKRKAKDFVDMRSQLVWMGRKKTNYMGFGVTENFNLLEHKASLEDIMKRMLQLCLKSDFEYGALRQVSGSDRL